MRQPDRHRDRDRDEPFPRTILALFALALMVAAILLAVPGHALGAPIPHAMVGAWYEPPNPIQPASAEATRVAPAPIDEVWLALAECESHGDWTINTGNGYYGGLQFSLRSWQWVGGQGYPHEASMAEQVARAEVLLDRQGWGAWPACSRKLGLR